MVYIYHHLRIYHHVRIDHPFLIGNLEALAHGLRPRSAPPYLLTYLHYHLMVCLCVSMYFYVHVSLCMGA